MLICNRCLEPKPESEFYPKNGRSRGFQYACKFCQHSQRVVNKSKRRQYYRDYSRTWEKRARTKRLLDHGLLGVKNCMICGKGFDNGKEKHIDHDHDTGLIRGILCRGCNCGLGNFRESPEIMLRAIAYLKEKAAAQ